MPEPVRVVIELAGTNERVLLSSILHVPGATSWAISDAPGAQQFVEEDFPLQGAPDPPEVTYSIIIIDLPTQIVQSTNVRISANLLSHAFPGAPGQLVEAYNINNFLFAVESGDASFGVGADADLLTVGTTIEQVTISVTYNVAEHPAIGTVQNGTTSIVAAVTTVLQINNLPSEVVEGSNNGPLTASELDAATLDVIENPATGVTWSVGGADPATITGPNSDILTVDPASAPDTIDVTASKGGVTPDTQQTTVIAAPPVGFPVVIGIPAGSTVLNNIQGDTLTWPNFLNPTTWTANPQVSVETDVNSKFGQVVQKRSQIGDGPDWIAGALNIRQGFTGFRQLYFRLVGLLSSNWQFHSFEDRLFKWGRRQGGAVLPTGYVIAVKADQVRFKTFTSSPSGFATAIDGTIQSLGSTTFFAEADIARGVYHTVEVLHTMNSAINASDGSIRVAIDGFEITLWQSGSKFFDLRSGVRWIDNNPTSNMDWEELLLNGTYQFLEWGGSGGTKGVEDFVNLSELVIAGRNP